MCKRHAATPAYDRDIIRPMAITERGVRDEGRDSRVVKGVEGA